MPPLLLIAPCRAGTTIIRAAHLHGGAVVPVRKQICWDLSAGGQAGTAATWPPSQESRTGAPSVGRERGTSSNVGGWVPALLVRKLAQSDSGPVRGQTLRK